jgi:hypothetical protein
LQKWLPCHFCSLPTGSRRLALAALRPLSLSQRDKAQLPQWLYANFTLEKKVHGYQRLLALAYRLSLARSGGFKLI